MKVTHLFPDWMILKLRTLVEGDYETEQAMIKSRLKGVEGPVLDLGCGAGELFPAIDSSAYIGIDCNEYLLKQAKIKNNGLFISGDLVSLPFKKEVFSAAIFSKVGHHLDSSEFETASSEMLRVLSPGGILVFLDPEPPSSKTSLIHRLIVKIELGSHHRTFESSSEFFRGFKLENLERFRKRKFDFYIAVFSKPND